MVDSIEERLREVMDMLPLTDYFGDTTTEDVAEFQRNLAARGLVVCDITHPENVLEDRDISNMSSGEQREQAIARYLVGQGMESWRAETESRSIIAADPVKDQRAEMERLREFGTQVVNAWNTSSKKETLSIAIKALNSP